MSEPMPLPRTYSGAEIAAFRAISRRVWNQTFIAQRGPAYFACGPWWPKELRRRAAATEREAAMYRKAADALEREITATEHLSARPEEPA